MTAAFPDFRAVVERLASNDAQFVVIGGVAMVLRGSPRVTVDLDLCYDRSPRNLDAVASALAPFHPRLRGVPADIPFIFDARTLRSGLNFTFSTDAGDLDLLGEVPGLGQFQAVAAVASEVDIYGVAVKVLTLEGLERAKVAAGRTKDLLDLETIRSLKRRDV